MKEEGSRARPGVIERSPDAPAAVQPQVHGGGATGVAAT